MEAILASPTWINSLGPHPSGAARIPVYGPLHRAAEWGGPFAHGRPWIGSKLEPHWANISTVIPIFSEAFMLIIENLNLAHIFKNDKKYNLKASVSLSGEPILRVGEHLKVKLSRWFLDGISGVRKCRVGAAHQGSSIKKHFESLFCTAYQIRSFGACIENPAMALSLQSLNCIGEKPMWREKYQCTQRDNQKFISTL